MTFTSAGFALFFPCVVLVYYLVPARWQNLVLLGSSCLFYGFNLGGQPLSALVLILHVLFTYSMARAIERAEGTRRRRLTAAAILSVLAVLAVFKYYNALLPTLLGTAGGSFAKLALPLGISFYTFATISYLVDVSRGDMPAERDLVAYAAFVTFFGTITSGPICRARQLLPQLHTPHRWDAGRCTDALRLCLSGLFRWVAVANILGLYVNQIFEHLSDYRGLTLIFAALLYALELYFEFSGYSEIAQGVALALGLEIPTNFKTPYFATNFSGFWNRWHISLSSWLQDYVFLPLVWGRWTSRLPVIGKRVENPPMISSVAIVFILSGFWHGNSWPFVVWGVLQAVFRVGEELLHRYYKKPKKRPGLPLRTFKTVSVFLLWAASLVFFRVGLLTDGRVSDALSCLGRMFTGWSIGGFAAETAAAVEAGFYAKPIMVAGYFAFLFAVLALAFCADWVQCFKLRDKPVIGAVAKLRLPVRWAIYYLLIGCVLVAYIMQSGGFGTVSFAYAGF